ncbi:MAG: 16S rRNA (guanine(527)-N(7))-methyltransferase RsmG [Clostridia bacterium]|nr:16S rRNA (guanine(527)-N(7))-methyltransferase RsmG [Clostridia bacterium]
MSNFQETLLEGATALGLTLSVKQTEDFEVYKNILLEWNQKFNLTAITEENEVAVKHFIDSLAVLPHLPKMSGAKLLDVGTGAGFPGLPLKIMLPELEVCLLDSLQKRVGFLQEVIGRLELTGITGLHGRAEEKAHQAGMREKFFFVTARAVARLNVLLEYCLPFVKPGGFFIALKGAEVEAEVKEGEKALNVLSGRLYKIVNFDLPLNGGKRSLVLVEKAGNTPDKYPRKAGTPEKKPI